MNRRGLLTATGVFVACFAAPFIVEATENFSAFVAGLTGASTPLGSGDKMVVLQGGADKVVAGNYFASTVGPQTLTNTTINGASNPLTVLAASQLSGITPIANGGTGLALGTSGGVLCATGSTTYAFSAALTANLPVFGAGAGACPGVGSVTGNTTKVVSNTGANVTGNGGSWDANGNWVNNANAVFTNVVQSFTAQQTFATTLGTQNSQSGAAYTFVASDCGKPLYFTSSSAVTVTMPNNLPVPCVIQVEQGGAGQITFIPATGATGPANPRGFTKTFAQTAIVTLQVDTNSGANAHWVLSGDGA